MRDLIEDHQRLATGGRPVGRAVVTSVWGSAPRPEGSCLLATPEGEIAGSVSGGCVETATAQEIAEAITRGSPKLVTFGVTDENAWEVGLACGGTIKVLVEPSVRPEVLEAAAGAGGVVIATVVHGGELFGKSAVIRDTGGSEGDLLTAVPAIEPLARRALAGQLSRSEQVTGPGGEHLTVFFEVFPRRPRLVIFGGVHIAVALVPLAQALGYYTIVADGREAFLGRERFPTADERILGWPEEVFDRVGIDSATYICVLSHDPKFDEPALEAALRSPAAYVGAIGSKKTQAARRERLRSIGITGDQLERLHGPIGLDLGGRTPTETALAILGEMTAVRYGRSGGMLTPRGQPVP